jgi:hypothetical protein
MTLVICDLSQSGNQQPEKAAEATPEAGEATFNLLVAVAEQVLWKLSSVVEFRNIILMLRPPHLSVSSL